MNIKTNYFLLIFLYSFLYSPSFSKSFSIGTTASLEYQDKNIDSNLPIVHIIYERSTVIIEESWENSESNSVILYFKISSLNFGSSYNLNFSNDFEDKFDIIENKSFWIPFGTEIKNIITFSNDGPETSDSNISFSLENSIANLSIDTIPNIHVTNSKGGILALYLTPKSTFKPGSIFKNRTPYTYINNCEENADSIAKAPDLVIQSKTKDEGVSLIRLQALDSNNDNKPDFPYQTSSINGSGGDLIFYEVEIKNKTLEPIFNLEINNTIGSHTKMSFGDKLFTGTGFPILKKDNGEIIKITDHPKEGDQGSIKISLDSLEVQESIFIYYCVEIVK
ncbi:hypothetical protein [uncultured Cetobacterium sp.]|uniref:hypothetical protein n=1 Tax=uncultured Cetobacterium sp. TaxID=527638 RepID=UPI002636D356|nr:hypothetical protein [uncultured Cetobacterium sp.]